MHVLLVKTSSLGDVVHNLPVVSDIQQHVPNAIIDWVVEEGFADIPRLHPGVRRVIPVALRRWRKHLLHAATWREMAACRRDLREDFYDVVLDTQGLIKSALIARQAELAEGGSRLGYAAEAAREPLAAKFYDDGIVIPKNAHAVERNRWLAAAALGYAQAEGLDYGIAAAPLEASWLPKRHYAVLFTGTSRADKLWPEDRWLVLMRALAMPLILPSGSAEERARAERLAAQVSDAVVAPALSVAELAQLLAGARLVIGLDTGLTHLAAALRRPTLAIFCGSDPTLTGVIGADPHLAINLGQRGAAPSPADVIIAAQAFMP